MSGLFFSLTYVWSCVLAERMSGRVF